MNEMVLLQNIERRIQTHIQGAYANIVEVGRCLIEAKETGVVPHGQFEEWAGRVTGLQKRSYQRLMQVAREVSPESAMARLPITKITAILALPEKLRIVIVLYYMEAYSVEEISKALRVPRGTVCSRLARAREQLKRTWKEEAMA